MISMVRPLVSKLHNYQSRHYEWTIYGKQLRKMKNMHSGEACFIIGNGPSLSAADLNLLNEKHVITFGMNRVYKMFDKTAWRPTYYVSEDYLILKDIQREIERIPARVKFFPVNLKWDGKIDISNALYFYMDYTSKFEQTFGLSMDAAHSIRCRGTVATTCIQLAIYFGFSKIYLLGMDHSYSRIINENGSIEDNPEIKDYFEDSYDSDIRDQVVHDMRQTTRAFASVEQLRRKSGSFQVINATRGGKLEVFPRIAFDELFKE